MRMFQFLVFSHIDRRLSFLKIFLVYYDIVLKENDTRTFPTLEYSLILEILNLIIVSPFKKITRDVRFYEVKPQGRYLRVLRGPNSFYLI